MKPKPRLERACPWSSARIDGNVMFRRFRAAAINFTPRKWDKAWNADKLESMFREAAKRKVDLMVSTEGVLEGYLYTDVVWNQERVPALYDIAEPINGPSIRRFRRLAKLLRSSLCFGFAERVGREIYNSAVFIGPRGEICGTYHKVSEGSHPSMPFTAQGGTLRAFDTPLGRCGVLICSDRWSSITARGLVLDGARFLCIPSWGTKTKNQNTTVMARARENGVPIVNANVGGNLIISRGEISAYHWGSDAITVGEIDVPVAPSRAALLSAEREMRKYTAEVRRDWYAQLLKEAKKPKRPKWVKPSLVAEAKFRKLQRNGWGASRGLTTRASSLASKRREAR